VPRNTNKPTGAGPGRGGAATAHAPPGRGFSRLSGNRRSLPGRRADAHPVPPRGRDCSPGSLLLRAGPTPRRTAIPTAVVGSSPQRRNAWSRGLEEALDTSLRLHHYDNVRGRPAGRSNCNTSFARYCNCSADHAVLDVAAGRAAAVGRTGVDRGPGPPRRPRARRGARDRPRTSSHSSAPTRRASPCFYISLAAVVIGFIGSVQLSGGTAAGSEPG